MTTLQDHFSIGEDYKRLKDILDQKARQGDKSKWICKTLLKQYDEEERGQQSFDDLIREQKRRQELNTRLDHWLILLKQIDHKTLTQDYDRQERGELESILIEAVYQCRRARGVNLDSRHEQNWRI